MARVELSVRAVESLARLIETHSLPADTRERVKATLRPLSSFPLSGAPLEGRWEGYRFILGPWRWMLVVYVYDETLDRVAIVTIQDARSSRAVTATR